MCEGSFPAFLSFAALAVTALSCMKRNRLPLQVLSPVIKFDAILASANNLQVLRVIWATTRSSKSTVFTNTFQTLPDIRSGAVMNFTRPNKILQDRKKT